jgi:hypothetical protein
MSVGEASGGGRAAWGPKLCGEAVHGARLVLAGTFLLSAGRSELLLSPPHSVWL